MTRTPSAGGSERADGRGRDVRRTQQDRAAAPAGGSGATGRVKRAQAPQLTIDTLIGDRRTRIVVCCGSGGVGKTTTAAAIGLRAAELGRSTVVLTIDPARRLAQSLGLAELDNVPRRIEGVDTSNGGDLWAMMLDMKRTFDEIVEAHTDPGRASQILANPFYQSLSAGFAGTQEYMAMEKLGQLRAADEWDLIVVDTPPSRSALDFLDSPERLGRFLDGRFIRLLVGPAKSGGRAYLRMLTAGFGLVAGAVTKVLGAQLLKDAQTFVTALDTMFGGFRERAEATFRLLKERGTAFLVVAAPEPDALREASYFVERLTRDDMPVGGLVLNRVHRATGANGRVRLGAERSVAAAETLEESGAHPHAAAALRLHSERLVLAAREGRLRDGFVSAHPRVAIAEVPALPSDVHDLDGLRAVGDAMAARS